MGGNWSTQGKLRQEERENSTQTVALEGNRFAPAHQCYNKMMLNKTTQLRQVGGIGEITCKNLGETWESRYRSNIYSLKTT